jgi:hypothetical protein
MPQTVQYRLTIRDVSTSATPNPTTNLLVVSSIAGGSNPYIAAAPQGDGVEIDPLTGTTRSGAYVVEVVDANTGTDATGTIRVVTNKLEDAAFRQQMISRRALVEVLRDSVATTLISGYVTSVRLVSPMRYAITIGDSRRQERTQAIFQGAALGSYTTRGTFTGGPITANFGTVRARGGWKYRVDVFGDDVQLTFQSGYEAAQNSPVVTDWTKVNREAITQIIEARRQGNPYAIGGGSQFVTSYTTPVYDFTTADWVVGGGIQAVIGSTTTNGVAVRALVCGHSSMPANEALGVSTLYLYWPGCPYSNGQSVYVSLTTVEVSEECPLYIDAHPVDIVTAIWTNARILYDPSAAWIGAVRSLIGDTVRLALRFDKAPLMDEFLPSAIYGPFGVSERVNDLGMLELVPTRIRTTTTPALTITSASLRGADEVVFDLDESTAVSAVALTQQVLAPTSYVAPNRNNSVQSSQNSGPVGGLTAQTITQTAQYLDPSLAVFVGRTLSYNVPGMIHTSADFVPNTTTQLDAMAMSTFDRFGRGCPSAEVALLATSAAAAALVGDEVYLEAPHYPNKGYRIGESTVGPRIMQVVRRTETPSGPVLRLMDSGLDAQPVAPAVTITIAQSPTAASSIARFTITNAAAINATAVLQVRVEQATGTVTPTGNGADFALYGAAQVPTGAVDLPPVITPGVIQYVRARTEQAGRRPSAWSAWAAVTLANLPAVTGLAASAIKQTAATIGWTNTSTTLPLAIFAYQGASAPANWAPFRVATIPAASTSTIVRSLSGPTVAWTLGVAYESAQALGAVTAVTLTTNSTLDTPTRPAGLAVIAGVDDVTLTQGVALALWASDQSLDIQIQRSTVSGSGFVTIATVAGSTPVYVDQLPRTGTTYYYKIAHVLGGFTTSSYTPEVSAIARGVPPGVVRPGAVTPVVQVSTSESGAPLAGTVNLNITDPQSRVTQVRFRHQTNTGGWSGWTVDTYPYSYSATIPSSGYVQIEYEVQGFDAAGTALQVLAGGVESFDADAAANIVSAVGTFNLAGALSLAVQADTDTLSFKYAVATSPWATDAAAFTAAQAGTLVNARNVTATLAGPFAVGSSVYLAIAGYTGASGTGTVSGPFRYTFTNGSRDTITLTARARITSTTSTTQVVRVAVADPVPGGAATIAFTVTGLATPTQVGGAPLPGTITVTPATTLTEAAGTYYDFELTRPASAQPPGRINFTVTATDRAPSAPAATVVAQDIIGPSLQVVTTPSANTYSLVITYIGTITYALDGIAQSTAGFVSPHTLVITRNEFLSSTQLVALSVTRDGSTVSETINVPPKDNAGATITIGTQSADDTTNVYTFTFSTSGMPTGTTFDLTYTTTTTAGVIEQGTLNNQTSPINVSSGYAIGSNPTYQMTITAIKSGTLVLVKSRSGTFLT